jgi:hypothetical protein
MEKQISRLIPNVLMPVIMMKQMVFLWIVNQTVPVLARMNVLAVAVLAHPNSGAVLFPAVKTATTLAQRVANAVLVPSVIFLFCLKELLTL